MDADETDCIDTGCLHRPENFDALFKTWGKIRHLVAHGERPHCVLHKEWSSRNCWLNINDHLKSHTIEEQTLLSMMATTGRKVDD